MSAFEWDKPTAEQLAARKRWVELLRSGKYEQLKGYLATEDGTKRCCLGVACDPVVTGIEIPWSAYRDLSDSGEAVVVRDYEDSSGQASTFASLPGGIADRLGLYEVLDNVPEGLPSVKVSDLRDGDLATLNDNGTPFLEIADLIEATYITPHEQVSA